MVTRRKFQESLSSLWSDRREVSLENWNSGWYLLQLDEPFDYQHKISEPYVFREMRIGHLLIKSRWEGVKIGEARTSVFVLLVPDASVFETGKVSSEDFIPACWGASPQRHPIKPCS